MAKNERSILDRYLFTRDGVFQYHRKVPKSVRLFDDRYPKVRISLFTKELSEARIKRDALERADNEFWASLLLGNTGEAAISRHRAAVARAEAMGFSYRTAKQLLSNGVDIGDLMSRIDALDKSPPASPASDALLGQVDEPVVTVREAFEIFLKEVAPPQLLAKSEYQKKAGEKVKRRAVENFVRVIGNVAFSDITRDQARRFYQMWMARIAPATGKPTHTPSSGNRDLGNLRKLFREYHDYMPVSP